MWRALLILFAFLIMGCADAPDEPSDSEALEEVEQEIREILLAFPERDEACRAIMESSTEEIADLLRSTMPSLERFDDFTLESGADIMKQECERITS